MSKKLLPLCLCIFWLLLIFFLSTQNGDQTAAASSGIASWLANIIYGSPTQMQINDVHMLIRKVAHFGLFYGFGVLSTYTLFVFIEKCKRVTVCFSMLVVLAVAIFDEWHKTFIPGRHCHIDEILLNAIAGILGVGFVVLVVWCRDRKVKSRAK